MEHSLMRQEPYGCPHGAEVILRRLFKKLFSQVDDLQPSELDHEIVFQSIITYDDYLAMVNQEQDDQLNCASLNRIENILSNLMKSAVISRPMHTSQFSNLWLSLGLFSTNSPLGEYSIALLVVCLTAWFLNNIARMRWWTSMVSSMFLVGFVEFCMHKNELVTHHRLIMERCKDPPLIARIAYWFNYDYDGCRSGSYIQKENIAFMGVDYLSELILRPMVQLGEKFGEAMQSYLNSFTGFNYLLAPIFPIVLTIVTPFVIYLLIFRHTSRSSQPRPISQSGPPLPLAGYKPEPINYHG